MTGRWERFKHWLTHGTCERPDCGASVRRMDLRSNQFIAGGLNLCPTCRELWYTLRDKAAREARVQKHMEELAERHEAALRFEARHGIYRDTARPTGEAPHV